MMKNLLFFRYYNINPIAFSIFSLDVYWYGLIYLFGFFYALSYGKYRLRNCFLNLKEDLFEEVLYICFFSIIIGGRLGCIIFYDFSYFLSNPFYLFKIRDGGMSFYGGFFGSILAIYICSKRYNKSFFLLSDFLAPLAPFCIAMGRIGNFINGELWGKVSLKIPWAIFFKNARSLDISLSRSNELFFDIYQKYGALPRHPSQIYESLLEGFLLHVILNHFISRFHFNGSVSSIFLICYGFFRIFCEVFREPDLQIKIFMIYITIGQILSIFIVILGIYVLISNFKK